MYDAVVIGAGPAGLTAALNLLRAGRKVLVLESKSFGGQIAYSPRVENFPSFYEITGSELADRLVSQVTAHGGEFDFGLVNGVISDNGLFRVNTEYGSHDTKSVIIATGVKHRTIGLENETRLSGKGVFYCATCDGAFYKDKDVAVLGDGNSAVQYALYLANVCKKVYLITLFDRLFCDKELEIRLTASEKIEWVKRAALFDILGDDKVSAVKIIKSGQEAVIDVEALFIAIGQIPDNEKFAALVNLDADGYISAGEDCKTRTEGVYVAGDCRTKKVRQLTTAMADGAVAAANANAYLDKKH